MSTQNHQSGDGYQSTFENAVEGIFQSSMEGRLLKVNPAMARIYGYASPEDMIAVLKTIAKQLYVDIQERNLFLELFQDNGHVENFEARHYRKDGSVIWAQTNAHVSRDSEGNPLFIEGFVTDITSRKETELALRASEERYRALVNRLPGAVFLDTHLDSEDAFYVSPKIEELLGYSVDEWISEVSWSASIHPDDRERILAESKRTDDTGESFRQEYRLRKKNGDYIWIREESVLVTDERGKPSFWQGFFLDISDQKQAENAIHQREEQFKKIFQANPIASCIETLKEGRFVAVNDAYWNLTGFNPDEFIGHTSVELGFVNAAKRKRIVARLQKEKSLRNEGGKLATQSSEYRDALEFFELITFNGQECILSMFYDITDQLSAQKALQESEERYRLLVEMSPEAIAVHSKGHLIFVNHAAVKLMGAKNVDELLDKPVVELVHPDYRKMVLERITQAIKLGKTMTPAEEKFIRLDGTSIDVEVRSQPIVFQGKPSVQVFIRDITEKKHSEEALKRQFGDLTILHNIAIAASSSKSVDELISRATDTISNTLFTDNCGVALVSDSGDTYSVHPSYRRASIIENPKPRTISTGVTGKVIRTGKAIRLGNVREEPAYHAAAPSIQSELCVPIKIQNRVIGVINVESNKAQAFTEQDERLLITIAGTLATSIEQIRLFETSQRRLRELSILNAVALAGTRATSLDDLLESTTQIIDDSLTPDNCGVELVMEQGDMYQAHPSYRGASKNEIRLPRPVSEGITGKVITAGKPVRLGDVTQEPAYLEVTPGIQSELCVPIKIQDRVIGVVNIESKTPDAYNEADERLFNTIAGTLATSIEQLRHLETSQRRLQELSILNAVTLAGTRATSLEGLLENITQIIGDSLYPDNFGVLLLNETGDALHPHPSYRGVTLAKFPKTVPINRGVSGQVVASGLPVRIANVRTHKGYIEVTSQVRSELCVPITHGEKVLGVINAESIQINFFTEDDERLLSTIASTLATAIEKLRLLDEEKRGREDADILREAIASLTTSLHISTLFDVILENLSQIVSFDSASIALKQGDDLQIVAGKGFPVQYNVIGKSLNPNGKWRAIDQKQGSLIVSEVPSDPEFEQWEGSEYIQSWVGTALITQGKIIGYIFLDSCKLNHFTQRDTTLIETFASSAAVAIENAHLFEEEQEQRQRSIALLDLMRIATSSLELDKVLQAILSYTTRLIPSDSGSIQLLEQGGLRVTTVLGLERAKILPGKIFPLERFPINAEILKEKQPIRINDVSADKRVTRITGADKIQSFLGIPLIIKNKVIGLINLNSYTVNNFSDSDMVLALAIANHAAFAIENARLFEAEQRRHRESETLRQAALAITTSLEVGNVLEAILIVMKQVIPFDSASVLLEVEHERLNIAATQGFPNPEYLQTLSFPAENELYLEIKKNDQPIILGNAQDDNRFHNWGESESVRGWIGVPLTVRGQTIGCITLDSHLPNAFDESLSALAQAFANQAAAAIQNARQFEAEQRHFQEAETLRQAAEAISSTLEIQQVLISILDNLNLVVPFDSASVFLIENDKVRLTAVKGLSDNAIGQVFPANNVLLQEIWQSRSPLILRDAQTDSRFEQWVAGKVHGWMGVPLIARGAIIGYITMDSGLVDAYNEHDATLALTFGHQAAAAIENARLYEHSEQQVRKLTILRDIDSAISSSFDLRVTLNLLIGHTIRELDADAASIFLYNPDLQALSLYASAGLTFKRNSNLSFLRIGEGLAGQVALQRKFIHIPDLSNAVEQTNNSQIMEENFTSYFGIPLTGKGQIKGVLEIYTRDETNPTPDWLNFLHTLAGQAAIAIDNVQLFKNLQRSNQELVLAYDSTLEGWGRALELRDKETQGHTDRVARLTIELARRMGMEGEELTNILRGTLLHDIGKMGIPDHILHKPGPLTEEEWDIMRQHPKHAYDLIQPIPYLRPALDIPYCHHERWDGSGYPRGLKGEDIPLSARIFAVVDIWDALLYERVYREAWPEKEVTIYLKNSVGIELDPNIVEIFLELIEKENRAD